MEITLIGAPDCPFCERVRGALALKEAAFGHREVDLAAKPPWFTALSPRGQVPVLVVDGEAFVDSAALCELVDELLPGIRLAPADPRARARARAWFGEATDHLFPPLREMTHTRFARKYAFEQEQLVARLAALEAALRGPWLGGEGPGLADLALLPLAPRLALLERLGVFSWPASLTATRAWAAAVRAHPALGPALPAEEGLLARWRAGMAWVADQAG